MDSRRNTKKKCYQNTGEVTPIFCNLDELYAAVFLCVLEIRDRGDRGVAPLQNGVWTKIYTPAFSVRYFTDYFYLTKYVCSAIERNSRFQPGALTLNLTAVGRSAHTFFKGLYLKKYLGAKNRQKIPIPRKSSPESKSRVMEPS